MSTAWAELARPRSMGRVAPLGARLSIWLARWREGFLRWREWRRSRQMLLTLDDRELRDIGLTRLDAWQEWKKPFWRSWEPAREHAMSTTRGRSGRAGEGRPRVSPEVIAKHVAEARALRAACIQSLVMAAWRLTRRIAARSSRAAWRASGPRTTM